MSTPPSIGIHVTGHDISADGDTLWRHRLDELLKEAIGNILPDDKKKLLPIYTRFPHTPYICSNPRPPINLVVEMTRSEVGLFDREKREAFLQAVNEAMTIWIRESHWDPFKGLGPDKRPPPEQGHVHDPLPDLLIKIDWQCEGSEYRLYTLSPTT